jgi:hypothetical protein
MTADEEAEFWFLKADALRAQAEAAERMGRVILQERYGVREPA